MAEAAVEADLRRLFAQIRLIPENERPALTMGDWLRQVGSGPGVQYLDDRAAALLGAIVDRVAQSAMVKGGRHPEVVDQIVMSACNRALDVDPDHAIAWLDRELSMPMRRWTVGETTSARFEFPQIEVGRCTLHRTTPTGL